MAQLPTPDQARRLVRENPQAVREQLLSSGLSEAEIRARLAAAGYPANALDDFLATPAPGGQFTPSLDTDALNALQLLGIAQPSADGLEFVRVTSGVQPPDSALADAEAFPTFGLDVFRRGTTLFQPLLYGPVSDDYRLGPGDRLVLVLTGGVQRTHELVVTRDGFVVIPDVGQVPVTNLTMADLRRVLRTRLGPAYSGIGRGTTTFDVTITELRTIQVYVSGQVTQPGAYQLASVATAMNALYAADGPTELANLRGILIRRRSGEEVVLDLYPYLLEGDVSGDVRLEQGDNLFVPLRGRRVELHGAVVRPAVYELAAADGLREMLAAAGGFAPQADRRRLTIHRVVRPADRGPGLSDRVAIDLELRPSTDHGAHNELDGVVIPPIGLQDGDSIVVDSVPALSAGYYVTIGGMVAQPDTFPWREGMTVRELMLLARGPKVGADLREAEVSRLPDDRAAGELADRLRVPLDSSYLSQRDPEGRYVGPPGVPFSPSGTAPEFELHPFDHVLILRQPDFQMPTRVSISGEVSVPGQYTLLSNSDRVTDLIERAGGLLPTAYPEGARLFRSIDRLGRIDLDLPAALGGRGGTNDLILQPRDSLHIPVYSPTVVVRGAVNSPVSVLFRQGADWDYYIANAGGYRHDADKGRASVRYANGLAQTRRRFLLWSRYPTPGPGSEILVPSKDPADRIDTSGMIADIVAILGSLTTVIVVITQTR